MRVYVRTIVLTELEFYRIHEDIRTNFCNFLWSPGESGWIGRKKEYVCGGGRWGVRPVVAVFELS